MIATYRNNDSQLSRLIKESRIPLLWIRYLTSLATTAASARCFFRYFNEKQKQKRSTQLPDIFCQPTQYNDALSSLMSAVLLRSIRPTLFDSSQLIFSVEEGIESEAMSNPDCALFHRVCLNFAKFESQNNTKNSNNSTSREEEMDMITLDWYFPKVSIGETGRGNPRKVEKLPPVCHPVILLLNMISQHNESECKYMMQNTMIQDCLKNGWIVVQISIHENTCLRKNDTTITKEYDTGLQHFGADLLLSTKREKHQVYSQKTHSLRIATKRIISDIQEQTSSQPIFLIGACPIGNDIITKYLGEEGMLQSLPQSICGAVTIGNGVECTKTSHGRSSNGVLHISVPFLQLITSDSYNDEQQMVFPHRQQKDDETRKGYSNPKEMNTNNITNPGKNPNIILVNVKMGKNWQWNVSRRYGLDEFYATMLWIFWKRGKNNKMQCGRLKRNWAERVSTKFISAILTLEEKSRERKMDTNKHEKGYFIPSRL